MHHNSVFRYKPCVIPRTGYGFFRIHVLFESFYLSIDHLLSWQSSRWSSFWLRMRARSRFHFRYSFLFLFPIGFLRVWKLWLWGGLSTSSPVALATNFLTWGAFAISSALLPDQSHSQFIPARPIQLLVRPISEKKIPKKNYMCKQKIPTDWV